MLTRTLITCSATWWAALNLGPDLTNIAIATACALVAYALISSLGLKMGVIRGHD
jgi:hypothetical protein